MQKIIAITGPTGVGKTALSVNLAAKSFNRNAAIINMDNVACFKELNIGSAKPTLIQQKGIPHYLLNSFSLENIRCTEVSTVTNMAKEACNEITQSNKIPILCGGSVFYLTSFLYGVNTGPKNDVLRDKIYNELVALNDWNLAYVYCLQNHNCSKLTFCNTFSQYALYSIARLAKKDPQRADKLNRDNKNDYRRLARALLIVEETGAKIQPIQQTPLFDYRGVVLYADKKLL